MIVGRGFGGAELAGWGSRCEVIGSDVRRRVDALRTVIGEYSADNAGPNIDLIVRSLSEMVAALTSLSGSYFRLADVFRGAGVDLAGLEYRAAHLEHMMESVPSSAWGLDSSRSRGLERERASLDIEAERIVAGMAVSISSLDLGPRPDVDVDLLAGALGRLAALDATSLSMDMQLASAALGAEHDGWRLWSLDAGQQIAYSRLVKLGVDDQDALDMAADGERNFVAAVVEALEADPNMTVEELLDNTWHAMRGGTAPRLVGLGKGLYSISCDGGDGPLRFGAAALAVLELSGHRRWAGAAVADGLINDDSLDWSESLDQLDLLSEQLATDGVLAAAFHNVLGPQRSNELLTREGSTRLELLDSLAVAAGTGELNFSGGEWYDSPRMGGNHSAAVLVSIQDLPVEFLASATTAAFNGGGTEWSWSSEVIGNSPLYTDWPPGGVASDLLLADLTGRSGRGYEGGPYGGRWDNPAAVMLAHLSDRDIGHAFAALAAIERPHELLNALGSSSAGGVVLAPDRINQILRDMTDPAVTGDPDLSAAASVWLVETVGGPEEMKLAAQTAAVVEEAILRNPTILVQPRVPIAEGEEVSGRMVRPAQFDGIGGETIDRALYSIFDAGGGGALLFYKDLMVEEAVLSALADGGPEHLPDGAWLGEIDGRIEKALFAHQMDEAESRDRRNNFIRIGGGSLAATLIAVSLPYVAAAAGVGGATATATTTTTGGLAGSAGAGYTISVAIGLITDVFNLFPTDHVTELYKQQLAEENDEGKLLAIRILMPFVVKGLLEDGDTLVDEACLLILADQGKLSRLKETEVASYAGGKASTGAEWFVDFKDEFNFANDAYEGS